MNYINHLTLQTGHNRKSPRSEVGDSILAILAPWLERLVSSGAQLPLPVADLAHFSATCTVDNGALLLTLFAPAGPHSPGKPAAGAMPLVTMGVAQQEQGGAKLWPLLGNLPGVKPGLQRPAEPWCAVAIHPTLAAYRNEASWIGDFERCVAWAWITRKPDLRAV